MKQIIIAGGGNEKDSKSIDELFVDLVRKKGKILYIPIAWSSGQYGGCKKWFFNTFSALGFTNFEMWTSLNNKKYTDIKKFNAVYIGGGNTYKLLYLLKKSGFSNLLKKFISKGGIVYGGSAGAIVLGKSIEPAVFGSDPDRNLVKISDLSGLNVLNGYTINCHYQKAQDAQLLQFAKREHLSVLALPEQTGAYFRNNKVMIIGSKPAVLFKDGRKRMLPIGTNIICS